MLDLNSFREPPTAQAYFRHNAMIVQSRGQPSDIGDGIVGEPPCDVLGALGFAAGARGSLPVCREVTRLSDRSVLFDSPLPDRGQYGYLFARHGETAIVIRSDVGSSFLQTAQPDLVRLLNAMEPVNTAGLKRRR